MWLPGLAVAVIVGAIPTGPTVENVRSRELSDLLWNISLVYESDREAAAFRMRAFLWQEGGECVEGQPCNKQYLYVSVATFDEYPEHKAFRVRLVGQLKKVAVIESPRVEAGAFKMAVYSTSAAGGEGCAVYLVSLKKMGPRSLPCG